MPNVKFSGFSSIASVGTNGFLVGYDSVTNLNTRITLADLKSDLGVMNPTSTYIPYNNAGTYADSYLVNDTATTVLKSVYGGQDIGINFDFTSDTFQIGNQVSLNYIEIDAATPSIQAYLAGGTVMEMNSSTGDFKFGGIGVQSWIEFANGAGDTKINTQTIAFEDNGTNALIANTNSGQSGNYLIITVNGTVYHLSLLNP